MTKNLRKRFHYCLLTPIAYTEGTVPLIYIFAAAKVQINEDITKQSYLFFSAFILDNPRIVITFANE